MTMFVHLIVHYNNLKLGEDINSSEGRFIVILQYYYLPNFEFA
jgi:hypothetical protein